VKGLKRKKKEEEKKKTKAYAVGLICFFFLHKNIRKG
jgi:hypothetical protein